MEKLHKEILGLMGKIDIDCRDEKDTIIIDLAGQLDVYNSHDVSLLIDAYRERGFHKFILNLQKVTYLDSSTISVFIQCYQTLKDEGRFVLAGLHGAPKEVFEMAIKNTLVIKLEKHATKDIHDSHTNGDLTVIWRDWDKILEKYKHYHSDDIFRLRLGWRKNFSYTDYWQCISMPEDIDVCTKIWRDLVGDIPCYSIDSYNQSVMYYLQNFDKFNNNFRAARDIPVNDIEMKKHFSGSVLSGGNELLLYQIPNMIKRYYYRSNPSTLITLTDKMKHIKSDFLNTIIKSDFQTQRMDIIRKLFLPKYLKNDDRNTMAFSIEGRYPLLDHELIELCLSFSSNTLYSRGWTKYHLRLGLNGDRKCVV